MPNEIIQHINLNGTTYDIDPNSTYYVTYNTTVNETEFIAAYNAGKAIFCKDGYQLIPLTRIELGNSFYAEFTGLVEIYSENMIQVYQLTYSNATWDLLISNFTKSDNYSSSSSNVMTGIAVNKALQTLDSSITATSGQAISAITITDGKISGSSKININSVPSGGTTGQFLVKKSNTNYDMEWITVPSANGVSF